MSKWKIFGHYFCNNCGQWFKHGCYSEDPTTEDLALWGDICPNCGALACEWYRCFSYMWYRARHKSAHKAMLEKKYKRYQKAHKKEQQEQNGQ